jgi:methyltransferase (TIGR00027 family)
MQQGSSSRTARAAARLRAAHQLLGHGVIFADPLAIPILGEDVASLTRDAAEPWQLGLRVFIAARSRFAEEALSAAVSGGVRQLVVLGAGLDTFAYRNPHPELHVYEVDHPDTQAWKRERLRDAGIAIPASLTLAPVDFERQSLADGLAAVGFRDALPSFFSWLGVVVYLTPEATSATLTYIASLSAGTHVVFDYACAPAALDPERRALAEAAAAHVAALGESWINYHEPSSLHHQLEALGYQVECDLDSVALIRRYLPEVVLPARESGPHVLHASCNTGA